MSQRSMPEAILLARRFQPYGAQGYRIVLGSGGTLLVGGARPGAARSVTLLPNGRWGAAGGDRRPA